MQLHEHIANTHIQYLQLTLHYTIYVTLIFFNGLLALDKQSLAIFSIKTNKKHTLHEMKHG